MSRVRIQPLAREHWGAAKQQTLDHSVGPVAELEGDDAKATSDAKPLNILGTIAHHPTLLEPFLGFAATLAMRGVLSRRHSELLALRTAWNCGSAFEWGHHVLYARAAGLSEREIERIATEQTAAEWSEEDRLLLRAADEMHRSQDVSDTTWEQLERTFTPAQLVEIPFVVGQYTMLSMVANTTAVPLEEGLPPLPEP